MARKRSDVNWRGKQVALALRMAAAHAVNETAAACVKHAKSNHQGWQNRSGTAEGSIRVIRTAQPGSSKPSALWGSMAVVYMRRLEFEHGSALRNAAQIEYANLPQRMKARIK